MQSRQFVHTTDSLSRVKSLYVPMTFSLFPHLPRILNALIIYYIHARGSSTRPVFTKITISMVLTKPNTVDLGCSDYPDWVMTVLLECFVGGVCFIRVFSAVLYKSMGFNYLDVSIIWTRPGPNKAG